MWPLVCVFRKTLRRSQAFAQNSRKGNSRKGREGKKVIAQSRSNCIRLNILFDCFSYEQIKNKMAASEEELFIAVQRYTVVFDKSNKDFNRKDERL